MNVGTTTAKTATTTTITASKTTPIILEQVTFTVQLTRSDTKAALANKPVTVWHYFNGVRYDDIKDKKTDGSGKVAILESFSTAGVRTYYASFAGDSQYATSQSSAVNIYVPTPTTLTIQASTQETTGLSFKISGTLSKGGGNYLPNQGVDVWAYDLNAKKQIYLGLAVTNANGAYLLSASVPKAGDYVCWAVFGSGPLPANAMYSPSESGDLLIYAGINALKLPQPTDLTLLVNPTQTPKVNSAFIIRGHLYTATYALADKEVYARYQYRASPSQQWGDWKHIGTTRTMSYADSGLYRFSVPLTQMGWYTFETVFSGDSTYHGSGSNRVEVVVT